MPASSSMYKGVSDGLCMACAGRERLKPAVDEAASQVEPMTKDVTSGVIRPGGEQLSKNAVPVTKEITENRVQPAVEQVSASFLTETACFHRGSSACSGGGAAFGVCQHSIMQCSGVALAISDRSVVLGRAPVWLHI